MLAVVVSDNFFFFSIFQLLNSLLVNGIGKNSHQYQAFLYYHKNIEMVHDSTTCVFLYLMLDFYREIVPIASVPVAFTNHKPIMQSISVKCVAKVDSFVPLMRVSRNAMS